MHRKTDSPERAAGGPARNGRAALLLVAVAALAALSPASAYSTDSSTVCSYNSAALTGSVHGAGMGTAGGLTATAGAGGAYTIALSGFNSYEGIVMWVRDAGGNHVGTFTVPGAGFRLKTTCAGGSAGGTLEHTNKGQKNAVSFAWKGDGVASGTQLTVEAVVVQTLTKWNTVPAFSFAFGGAAAGAAAPASGTAAKAATSTAAAQMATPVTPVISQSATMGNPLGLSTPLIIAIVAAAATISIATLGVVLARRRKRNARTAGMGRSVANEDERALRASLGDARGPGDVRGPGRAPGGGPREVPAQAPQGRRSSKRQYPVPISSEPQLSGAHHTPQLPNVRPGAPQDSHAHWNGPTRY